VQAQIPFSPARKWSGVSFAGHGTWLLGAPGVTGRHPAESASLPAEVADAVADQEAAGRPVLLLARHQRRALRLGASARRTPGRTCKPHGSGRLSGRAVQAVACRLAVPPMFSSPTGTAGGPL
jgi:hypothetical protein